MKFRPSIIGAALAGLAVIFGAFGAHALRDRLEPDELAVFQTAVQYQMYHALALILTGILSKLKPSKSLVNAGLSFVLGIILFSGSLYLITIGKLTHVDFKWIGPITPIGGLAFVTGWGLLVYHHTTRH